MKLSLFNYRFAEEILKDAKHDPAWNEIRSVLGSAPLFTYEGKSKNSRLTVVQPVSKPKAVVPAHIIDRFVSVTGFD